MSVFMVSIAGHSTVGVFIHRVRRVGEGGGGRGYPTLFTAVTFRHYISCDLYSSPHSANPKLSYSHAFSFETAGIDVYAFVSSLR